MAMTKMEMEVLRDVLEQERGKYLWMANRMTDQDREDRDQARLRAMVCDKAVGQISRHLRTNEDTEIAKAKEVSQTKRKAEVVL